MTENQHKKSGNGIVIAAADGVSSKNYAQSISMGSALGVAFGAKLDIIKNKK